MRRSVIAVAAAFQLSLAGCHPPDREVYDDSKRCVGVYHVALKQIPPARFRQAGLDRYDVDKASEGSFEDALKFGANAGLNRNAVMQDVRAAKESAWKSFAGSSIPASAEASEKLLKAVKECLPKPPPPNQ